MIVQAATSEAALEYLQEELVSIYSTILLRMQCFLCIIAVLRLAIAAKGEVF
jgi:hypothetical protein